MTIADLLDQMQLADNELRTGNGQADEARALLAIASVQRWFDALAGGEVGPFLQTHNVHGVTPITMTAGAELTTWPARLYRIDSVWICDSTTYLPTLELGTIQESGGHRPALSWPYSALALPNGPNGCPARYFAGGPGSYFYWDRLPDQAYVLRIYGYWGQAAATARGTTFGYPEIVGDPLALFAAKRLRLGRDDDTDALQAEFTRAMQPVLRVLRKFTRTMPHGRMYSQVHTT